MEINGIKFNLVLILPQPLFDRMLEMEESKQYIKNGVFNKAASLSLFSMILS